MKKLIVLVLSVTLIVLAGCGKQDTPAVLEDPAEAVLPVKGTETESKEVADDITVPNETDAAVEEATAPQPSTDPAEEETEEPSTAPENKENSTQPTTEPSKGESTAEPVDGPVGETDVDLQGGGASSNGGSQGGGGSEYERYLSMSPADQQAFMESFESFEAFFEWHNTEKAKYDAENPSIEIDGDNPIDLEEIAGN